MAALIKNNILKFCLSVVNIAVLKMHEQFAQAKLVAAVLVLQVPLREMTQYLVSVIQPLIKHSSILKFSTLFSQTPPWASHLSNFLQPFNNSLESYGLL